MMSCEKSRLNEPLENQPTDLASVHLSVVNDAIKSVDLMAPSRKAVLVTVTDLETDETILSYIDCSLEGNSCDVGVNPTPPWQYAIAAQRAALLSNAELRENIDRGNILVEEGRDYLALRSAKREDFLYVYKPQSEGKTSAEVVPTDVTSLLPMGITLSAIGARFPGQNLSNKIEKGDYKLYKGSNFLMIKPENPAYETYYVQEQD